MALRERQLDGWLFYDHHHRDPIAYRVLGLDESSLATRRWYYLIPAEGDPIKLVHRVERARLDALPGLAIVYSSWRELEGGLRRMLARCMTLAMQYSPRNALMTISLVDAGTVEMLRDFGKTIVSSADLVSRFEAVLSAASIESHQRAQRKIDAILESAWQEIGLRVGPSQARGDANEHSIVAWLREALKREGLVYEHGPNVSVNANSANPHYEPSAAQSSAILAGDFVLIDIWGRVDEPGSCFYDITWTGVVGREPREREREVFDVVVRARDAAIERIERAFRDGESIAGWEADDAARQVIAQAGMGEFFTHRTGHSIASELHGNGANLDNLEAHDDRVILPYTCFSVEPGIYLREFGIRSEVNMITSPSEARVTGRTQRELVRIG